MKPPLFEYLRPNTLEEAIAARSAHDYSAVLAGGQSLIPTMNFRIANPTVLIDISRIESLKNLSVEDDQIIIGAMVRQRAVELNNSIYKANPLVRETLEHVAHVPIRSRGTVVGSLAHADAAAELPALLIASGGSVVVQSASGSRIVEANSLFKFHMTTTLSHDEIITEVRIPSLKSDSGWAFQEFTRRPGDYAIAGVAVILNLASTGECTSISLAACGIAQRAVRLEESETLLKGTSLDVNSIKDAALAAKDLVTTADDTHASNEFRRHVLATLLQRAIIQAKSRAGKGW